VADAGQQSSSSLWTSPFRPEPYGTQRPISSWVRGGALRSMTGANRGNGTTSSRNELCLHETTKDLCA